MQSGLSLSGLTIGHHSELSSNFSLSSDLPHLSLHLINPLMPIIFLISSRSGGVRAEKLSMGGVDPSSNNGS